MENKEPPVILVKTWVSLLASNESKEVRDHAVRMLTDAFGDIKKAAEFCKRNNIGGS